MEILRKGKQFIVKQPLYFVSGGFHFQVITLLSLVAIGLVEVKITQSSFATRTHITTWSKEYMAVLLEKWLLIISHPSIKFYSNESRESKFKTFFICHVTLCDHVINRLCDLMDNKSALEPTTLSSLVAIGLAELEI